LSQESYLSSAPTKPSSRAAPSSGEKQALNRVARHLDAVELQANLGVDAEMRLEGHCEEGVGMPEPPLADAIPKYLATPTERRTGMGRIVISENVSLDGVIQDPAGVEGFRFGGWVGRIGDQGREQAAKVALDEALGAEAMLLGRRSYEFLAARWPSRSGPLADRLNSLPKYVVSSTIEAPAWSYTTVVKGDVIHEVSKLKQDIDGEIVVAASFQLWHMLMEHDLVDELRLMFYPVVLGAGERLFGETSDKKPVRLVSTKTVDDLALLTYEPVRAA
jgi:dihydrofolate reductase